ncbi:MAG TPA: phosphoglycerate dehydrogenase [Tepidisphaeraceae bacterium]|jgi:D-3-phosphoglycerate dehydrogenase|nr:phosphoglycerate dehydrogenase [Tepidisphaeraceae bacterium]
MKILLTTTSYQDTPGKHHDMLDSSGLEVVRARGPLTEAQMLDLITANNGFDGLLNGDDHITAKVIDAALNAKTRLRVIAKYGIGLDSIDVKYATSKKIPVLFTPGVNHTTVAEHAFGLMIALAKHFWPHLRSTKKGEWKRITGTELFGKTIAVLGVGRIGKEVIKRARAFDMNAKGYDVYWDHGFAEACSVSRCTTVAEAIHEADIVSLHMNLDDTNRGMFNKDLLASMKKGAFLINTARGGLVNELDIAAACKSGHLGGYGTDVLDKEPPAADHPFRDIDNIIVTPHVGSRTFESVERQAMRATLNIVNFLNGDKDYIQANQI